MIDQGDGSLRVWFQVDPGPPRLVTAREISVDEPAAQVTTVAAALEAFMPRQGERFNHAQYEASKTAVQEALADHGYLDAKLTTHRVEVNTAERSARITLAWEADR